MFFTNFAHITQKINIKRQMNTFKKCLPDVVAILLFALIGFAYFFVPVTQNKVLFRHDSQASKGLGAEQINYYERTGERTRWVNNLFRGMPTYQISPSYNSTSTLSQALNAYHLWLPENVWYIFAYLLGFYIMLRAFDFRQSLAALGSIIWAFSSYFLIIIAAGHIWKVMALAYLPPMIGGIVMAYRGKYLWGLIVTSIFAAFEVNANHAQMTYYFLFPILFIIIAIDPQNAKAIYLKGGALVAMEHYEEALELFKSNNDLLKKETDGLSSLTVAICLTALGRDEESYQWLDDAIWTCKDQLMFFMAIYFCFAGTKYLPRLYPQLKRVFALLGKNNKHYWSYMALMALEVDQMEDFHHYLQQAIKRNPDEAQLMLSSLFPIGSDMADWPSLTPQKPIIPPKPNHGQF